MYGGRRGDGRSAHIGDAQYWVETGSDYGKRDRSGGTGLLAKNLLRDGFFVGIGMDDLVVQAIKRQLKAV